MTPEQTLRLQLTELVIDKVGIHPEDKEQTNEIISIANDLYDFVMNGQAEDHTFTLKKGNVIKLNGYPFRLLEDIPLTVSDDLKIYGFVTSTECLDSAATLGSIPFHICPAWSENPPQQQGHDLHQASLPHSIGHG